jgi:hypothetical protein
MTSAFRDTEVTEDLGKDLSDSRGLLCYVCVKPQEKV